MDAETYIKYCWDQAHSYCEGIEDGSIVCSENIKLALKRHKQDLQRPDLEWRPDEVEKVYRFFSYLNVRTNRQFILSPYQSFIILALFGLYYKGTDERKYQKAFLFIGRKNGKTTFVSGLQLYFMLKETDEIPESILITGGEDQTEVTSFKVLRELIHYSPAIKKRLDIWKSLEITYKKDFKGYTKPGIIKVMPGIPKKSEGLNPTSCILDEIHTYPNGDRFSVIMEALGTKLNPMLFFISTAGKGTNSFCAQMVEAGRNVLRGVGEDDRFAYFLFELDEGDDWQDEKNWIKVNPGLGTILDKDAIRNKFNTSKTIPSLLEEFQYKSLNIFVEEQGDWLPSKVLLPRFKKFDDAVVKDLPCYIGVDLSSTRDLTSIVCLWADKEEFYVKSYFFFVKGENNSLRKGNIDISRWVNEKYVIQCEGSLMDYKLIKKYLFDIYKTNNVKGVYYDPWKFKELANTPFGGKGVWLYSDDSDESIWCTSVIPGTISWDWPMRFVEKVVFEEKISFFPNKCLMWNFLNVAKIKEDRNGNIRPDKKLSKDAIDGVVSLLNSLYGYLDVKPSSAALFMKNISN